MEVYSIEKGLTEIGRRPWTGLHTTCDNLSSVGEVRAFQNSVSFGLFADLAYCDRQQDSKFCSNRNYNNRLVCKICQPLLFGCGVRKVRTFSPVLL